MMESAPQHRVTVTVTMALRAWLPCPDDERILTVRAVEDAEHALGWRAAFDFPPLDTLNDTLDDTSDDQRASLRPPLESWALVGTAAQVVVH